ncbi:hypothetical protein G7Y89_g10576 [Cudoniella acicularis]|uniref:Cytochrome P450 n=1 Tax=Cudoniella acicularis TaxID=354080 RepID=A0A8H4RDK5_9HELO|nr:hypothetical protein G7Y89_g10576 [Cudoniella acicularis]
MILSQDFLIPSWEVLFFTSIFGYLVSSGIYNLYRAIYSHKSNVRKGDFYISWRRNSKALNTANTVDPTQHARKRRVVNAALSEQSVRSAEPFIIQHVDRWCDILLQENGGSTWSSPKNMSHLTNYLTLDLMGDLCFGKSFDTKELAENQLRDIPDTIAAYLRFLYALGQFPFLALWNWLKPLGLDALFNRASPPAVQRLYNFIDDNLDERIKLEKSSQKQLSGPRKDMFHYLYHAQDPETGKSYSQDELFAESSLVIIAGSDTTAVVLSGFFFYITRNSEIYNKLQQEIRKTFSDIKEISGGTKLSSCKYLRACIDEVMRINPPGPSELPRVVLQGGLEVEGQFFPEGTNIGVPHWSLHHREDIFVDPWKYRPERWIVDDVTGVNADDVFRAQSAFFPFSSGSANCAGQKLAMAELMIIIARTFYRMDVRAAPGDILGEGGLEMNVGIKNRDLFQCRDAYIAQRDGPMVQFKGRGC